MLIKTILNDDGRSTDIVIIVFIIVWPTMVIKVFCRQGVQAGSFGGLDACIKCSGCDRDY